MSGQVAVITGASSGIGAALAGELARRGVAVGLLARRRERLEELVEELTAEGHRAAFAVADVKDGEALHQALDQLEEELGPVTLALANAGFGRPEPPHRFKPERAANTYDVNFFGMLRLIDWALPRFLERGGGHLAGVASVASFFGLPDTAAYCGSKAAMRVHLQSLRLSLRRYNIAVTTICPGFVVSELTDQNEFPMPFLWPTERAARRIADALGARAGEVVFPWQMRLLMGALTRLPTSWAEALVRRSVPPARKRDPEPKRGE